MAMAQAEQCCFLRTNTAEGCVTHLSELCAPEAGQRVVHLRSGLGGASAALLAALAERGAGSAGAPSQSYWDAPGRERRCAVCLPEHGIVVLDAEPPWPLEAKLPGAGEELVSLDQCRDNAALRERREELRQLFTTRKNEQERAGRFLRAARAMKRDMAFVAGETLDIAKIERYASRFALRRLPAPTGHVGRESKRFMTAITGQGLLLRRSVLNEVCTDTVVLEDEYGVAAPLLWNLVRAYALGNGQDIISCACLLFPDGEPEHLVIPGLGLACFTANRRHPISFEDAQRIQASRFFDKEALREHRCRLSFCRRTMRELLAEAYQAQEAADKARAAMDTVYARALIPGAIEDLAERILKG